MEHGGLQREHHDGRAKNKRAIDVADRFRGLPQREENGDDEVEQKEKDQERLSRREVFRPILQDAPHRADREGEHEPGDIEWPPCLEPGNGHYACIEHRIVTEEHDMASLAGGCQNWR